MKRADFEALMAEPSKTIEGDIAWSEDADHAPWVEFRASVRSDGGHPLFVRGAYNSEAKALTFALVHRAYGRIYALDIGKEHHNPTCEFTGEVHKHAWDETYRDKLAYVPTDIEEELPNVVGIWRDFCREARIRHTGTLATPPPRQQRLFP